MTKKDFKLIAQTIKNLGLYGLTREERRENLAEEFAAVLATTNPRFDKQRFLEACK